MAIPKSRQNFFESEEGKMLEKALEEMTIDESYNTKPSYTADSGLYPDNKIAFVTKHMNFIKAHPSIDPSQYLSNLRLMTRIR